MASKRRNCDGTGERRLFFSFVIGPRLVRTGHMLFMCLGVTRTSHTHYPSKMDSDKSDDSIMPMLDVDDKASVLTIELFGDSNKSNRPNERHTRSLHRRQRIGTKLANDKANRKIIALIYFFQHSLNDSTQPDDSAQTSPIEC